MKEKWKLDIYSIPLILWLIVTPLIVKRKLFPNPLMNISWFSSEETMADFFLYYKSMWVTISGVLMLIMLVWMITQMRRKNDLFSKSTYIFVPLVIYAVLAILSSVFSEYRYFAVHGMPDQFETVWNIIAYVVVAYYCYYMIVYRESEKNIVAFLYIGAGLVGLICFLQFLKLDIYRLIYAGDGYSFTFAEGTVYGPFYNINYVGSYVLLLMPLFVLAVIFGKNIMLRVGSAVLVLMFAVSMLGAESITAWIVAGAVLILAIVFFVLKQLKGKKAFWAVIAIGILIGVGGFVALMPRIGAYVQASDTEKQDLKNIFTRDDCVEIHLREDIIYIAMDVQNEMFVFDIKDQNEQPLALNEAYADEGYMYYTMQDSRFADLAIIPTAISKEEEIYGFAVRFEGKDWWFTNEVTEDETYYYYTDWGKVTKLTDDTPSNDFAPLEKMSSLANGRGYIWNKTILMLKDYIFLGSGADSYALVYPNDDVVDKYNNGYDNRYLTKPHNLYLQIAVQTGMVSLICVIVFYAWYVISSLRIYFRQRFDQPLVVIGFAMLLGTFGYMLTGLANDSTITVAPIYWAMMGIGIGINHRIRMTEVSIQETADAKTKHEKNHKKGK